MTDDNDTAEGKDWRWCDLIGDNCEEWDCKGCEVKEEYEEEA